MLNGYDISSHNAEAGFRVANVPSDFVIVKATEGTGYTNPYFKRDADDALAQGRLLGIYHYATGYNWQAEADFFLNCVQPYIGKVVLILDFEAEAVMRGKVAFVKSWLDYIKSKTGILPWFYTYLNVENGYINKQNPQGFDWSSVANTYPLWVAQYNNYNPVTSYQPRDLYGSLKFWKNMTAFQYTSSGRIGNPGSLDLNVFYGTKADWLKYTNNNGENEVDEMSWHPEVKWNQLGMFRINRENGINLYTSPDLAIVTQEDGHDAVRKYGDFVIWQAKKGAVRLGTDVQWASQADGLTKINPLAVNDNAHAKCKIIADDAYTQNEPDWKAGGIKHLPKGSTWQVFGRVDKYLIVGGEKDGKYVNGDKTFIIL
ncbi:GH25 family lysozyme [Lactobacillus jensenii]|uniref:GH25 family lysozyme n=1 Tax=Lactobacillus jensenii TaxID=109790 RepID=UPI000C7E6B3C|nr:GH25 family lysozyme [Lactobacillus jensenii]PLA45053.1 glycosyl hydrolase family 25 [Lactobacillus jensenii]